MGKDYSKLSKEELLKVIEKLEYPKKYGLIWDEERTKEQFEKESENALPVLKEVKSKAINTDPSKPIHILIEGDNYHALSVLNYTHQGKIDVIYIDPPYNKGGKDFKYNDRYVDQDDTYRHSKWLSFMSKRLRLAKNLLNEDGVIFISIDDSELAPLRLLLNEIFLENGFLGCLTWVKRTKSTNSGKARKMLQQKVEYIVVYSKKSSVDFPGFELIYSDKARRYPHKGVYGDCRFENLEATDYGRKKRDTMKFPILGVKPRPGRRWQIGASEAKRLIKEGKIELVEGVPKRAVYPEDESKGAFVPFWSHLENTGTAESAKKELSDIIGVDHGFDTVKPTNLIVELLKRFSPRITMLDFFSGSGTSGQAVLELNKADNGNRSFILCTNNENNICSNICYPRIKSVVKGYDFKGKKKELLFERKITFSVLKNADKLKEELKYVFSENKEKYDDMKVEIDNSVVRVNGILNIDGKQEGFGGNLKYFKTAFVKSTVSKDSLKVRITRECTEMLRIREGIFDEVKKTDDYRIFEHNDRIMGVYYSLERAELKSLKKDLDKMKGEKILYCFTLDPLGLDNKDFRDWRGVSLEPIPQKILDIYEGIYEY